MRRTVSLSAINLVLLGLVLTATGSGCAPVPVPVPEPTSNKVIVSHRGQLTQDVGYAGDVTRYRINYVNDSTQQADITILDTLDPNLTQVTALDNGAYDEQDHTVIWEAVDVTAGQAGSVQFEAVIKEAGLIRNQASIQTSGQPEIETNTVETKVCARPRLGWIPFDGISGPGETPRAYMKDETTTGLMVNFDVPGMFVHEVEVDGVTYHRLSIPGHTTLLDLGKPELPIVGQIVEIPQGVDISIEIVKSESVTLECYNAYPAQERQIRQGPAQEGEFALDEDTYLTDADYPADLAAISIRDIGVIRGHRIVFLKVNPIQYNPFTREIKAFSNIEVRLNYDQPAQIPRVDPRIESQAFEELLQASVLNYKDANRFARGDAREERKEGCDYLIITHGDFYNPTDPNNPIVRLRDWKQRKGYTTKVVDVADIPGGTTADDIRDYIQDAYDNWDPVPTYVLLVGDAEFIPTNYQVDQVSATHPSHNNTFIGSDLYYVTVDGVVMDGGNVMGPDYFPDMFIGRLSVDTLLEAQNIVDKILAYEQTPPPTPANANYYTDASLVCLFEDDALVDGQEDVSFRIIEFATEIRTHLQNSAYNCARIYDQSGNWAAGPQFYENGTPLPDRLTIAGNPAAGIPGLPWNGATADIRNATNNGNFLVVYDGHGLWNLWDRPGFGTANIGALTNGALTPVVLSFACETGWFDNETDAANTDWNTGTPGIQTLGNADESFCEEFLRLGNAGAVAIIGATRISWDNNDFMMLGAAKAIWPDFDPNPPFGPGQLPDIEMGPLVRMGQINTFSKVYMANYYNDDFHRQASFEMYTLFGDPEMPVWTDQPGRFDVDHPEGIGSTGEQDFVVKVTDATTRDPVHMATVVLTRDVSIIAVRQTNPGGVVRFTLSAPGSGDLDITVTAHNYRPYQESIKVNIGGAALNRLDPDNGVANQTVHVGGQDFSGSEDVDVYFADQLALTRGATAGSFGQSGVEDVDLQVPSPYELGPVNILAHGQTSDRYAADVFRVRTANPIDLYTYDQWDSTTWHLHAGDNPIWNNPEIQLYDSNGNPVESNNLTAGNTYTIKVKIHNDTEFEAKDVTVTFKWANFGVGQPDRVWEVIGTDAVDIPAHQVEEAQVQWAPPSTGHLCIMVEIYHIEDINESNNKGQENCHVGPTSSPAEVCFVLWNPTEEPTAVHLELRQLITPAQQETERLWETWVRHPDPQVIPPGERTEACVIMDPKLAQVRPGQQAEFALTGFINRRVVGGVNFIMIKE